ncbi:MAG TPA: hypothetical protein VJB90_03650 [Candidatus Nanoarchaeia archaeon]|nr:hypothetical protein [Candidatus Nanoarchaeia archaeon]
MGNDHVVLLNEQPHIRIVSHNGRPVVYVDEPWTVRFRVQEGDCPIQEVLPPRIEAGYFHSASPVPSLDAITDAQEKDEISHEIHLEDALHYRPLLPVYFPKAV